MIPWEGLPVPVSWGGRWKIEREKESERGDGGGGGGGVGGVGGVS